MDEERFHAHLLQWVRDNGVPDAAAVTKVESHGTDWAGDTEAGFHSTFDVDIRGLRAGGETFWRTVEGEEMQSLWKWTVSEAFGDDAR